jgi:5-methylcytosine-specific restriction protein A
VEYAKGLEILLTRLGRANAVLTDVEVFTGETEALPIEQRRISVPGLSPPVALAKLTNVTKIRHELGRASAAHRRPPGSKGGGNPTKRLRFTVEWPSAVGQHGPLLEKILGYELSKPGTFVGDGQSATQPSGGVPASPQAAFTRPESQDELELTREAYEAPTADLGELEARAQQALRRLRARGTLAPPPPPSGPLRTEAANVERFLRDPNVVAWVKAQANGTCEACGSSAPFATPAGEPFLEVHHVRPLAQGGPDQVDNAIAVCPNCHRRLHHSRDSEEFRRATLGRVERLRDHPAINIGSTMLAD